ncbi:uncharacterized protein LY89DRAFT_288513 [Mollisia scopiformis]|uniref:Uncharacterized protein n=1 Tax=Mollisia scopiformis TaxID=149040 RepID=A0A132BAQ3_MOLSC|nr:uncharacterized protein LY89DRAFT_288513 [Mollisia scopiformis]KUJ09466.1 hypothetical protein LY89DRAFT_288513 [Mollisia scopiformis]
MHQPISDAILRSFEQISPNPRIFYDLQSWGGGPAWSLTNSSLLYSLKADIEWADEANYEAVDFVFAALANATGLRELDLYLHHEGCVVGRDTPQAFPFAGYPDVRFQPLEVLRLDGYKLDESEDGGWEWKQRGRAPWKAPSWSDWFREKWFEWSRKKWFGEVGENEATESNNRRTNLEAWLEVMDWSHLHTLHLAWPSKATLNHLQGQTLPALTNLSLAISDYFGDAKAQDIIPFLTNTAQPLRGVIIKSSQTELGDPILETFIAAPNLTQELRQFSYRHGPELEDKSFLSQDLISKFLHSTPSLESLDIELPRDVNTSTDTGLFSNLINSPSLKKTTLRFPSPDLDYQTMRWDDSGSQLSMQYHEMRRNYYTSNGTDDEADPLFNEDTALAMFKKMRARKRGAELKELELYVGDWEDRDFRGMMGRVMVRVAYWGCFVVDGAERCEGGQMRLLE